MRQARERRNQAGFGSGSWVQQPLAAGHGPVCAKRDLTETVPLAAAEQGACSRQLRRRRRRVSGGVSRVGGTDFDHPCGALSWGRILPARRRWHQPTELCVLGLVSLFHMMGMGQSRARYDFRRSRFCLSSGTGAAVGAMLVCPSVAATEGLGTRSGSDETHTRFHAVL